jgi:8-oxo-dGTP diphosphatase
MHETPKQIMAVSLLVKNPADQVLLVKTFNRGWDLPGGQVELGESLIDAAKRETVEESGIVAQVGRTGSVNSNLSKHITIMSFLGIYISGEPRGSDETSESRWFSIEDVLPQITPDTPRYYRIQDLLVLETRIRYRAYTTPPFQITEEYWI